MLSLYRAWLPPIYGVLPRPAPPPGAHRPIPRRADQPPSPAPTDTSSELDVEHIDENPNEDTSTNGAVLDVACCDGPVRFSRVLNEAWKQPETWPCTKCRHASRCNRRHSTGLQYYPCKTCGSKFPSYYFVHKHRKICHAEEETLSNARSPRNETLSQPQCSSS